MKMENDELKYKSLIDSLKELKKIETPDNFDAELMRNINTPTNLKQKSFFDFIFSPVKLIPSAALAVTTVILIFIMNNHSTEIEDPFSVEPRLREDIFVSKVSVSFSPESSESEYEGKNYQNGKKSLDESKKFEKNDIPSTQVTENLPPRANDDSKHQMKDQLQETNLSKEIPKTEAPIISKTNLNFMQIKLTDSSRDEVAKLKENVSKYLKLNEKTDRKTE